MSKELEKQYNPQNVEERIYGTWVKNKYFHAKREQGKKTYTIVIPPPNITGQLHMGHALDNTLQDILIRYHRMAGYDTLWLPGTDHASIATEAKIVEAMRKEGITKEDLGRDKFLERAWKWKEQYGGRIIEQLKKMGSSCDWDRERFTLDEGCSKAVREVFVRLYEKDLIYRGNRMVNWCPHCNTSISDAEVEYEEKDSNFWHLLYTVKETGEKLELATTRPETMLGDTAVAINGDDPRYAHLHGCHVILPLLNKEIPIVCDEHADMTKGTGVVKITPAHDPNDFEVGLRHDLPIVRTFTYDGHMTGAADKAEADELRASGKTAQNEPEVLDCGKYAGMTTLEARKAILKDLEEGGYIKEIEPIKHEVGTCYRCHTSIEPMVSKQWFVRMEPLAKPAIESVEKGDIKFIPERFTKNYMNWMRGTRDWCISRQLWWGHRIPAWYCDDCGETVVEETAPECCPKCGGKLRQDEDVLDTWFSSGMWPFSTLGWPDKTEELKYYYPTATLATGYDLIFFWIARMIMFGLYAMDDIPFHTVYIHGMVRDELGRKMSKSLGNGIDPLEVIKEYGVDSLRFSLTSGTAAGTDMRFSPKKVEAARNFCNKIYNASRFVMMNLGNEPIGDIDMDMLDIADKWILHRLNEVIVDTTANIDSFDLNLAVDRIYSFIWTEFCDWYIEMAKPRLYGEDEAAKRNVRAVLVHVLSDSMKLLHPFMPFITEDIYTRLPGSDETIMLSAWPKSNPAFVFPKEAEGMDGLMDMVRSIRNVRVEMNVPPAKRAHTIVVTAPEQEAICREAASYLNKLASASTVEVRLDKDGIPKDAVSIVSRIGEAYIPMTELIDIAKELERLEKERKRWEGEVARANGKLNNQGFMAKAPEKVVAEEREKLKNAQDMLAKVTARIEEMKAL